MHDGPNPLRLSGRERPPSDVTRDCPASEFRRTAARGAEKAKRTCHSWFLYKYDCCTKSMLVLLCFTTLDLKACWKEPRRLIDSDEELFLDWAADACFWEDVQTPRRLLFRRLAGEHKDVVVLLLSCSPALMRPSISSLLHLALVLLSTTLWPTKGCRRLVTGLR